MIYYSEEILRTWQPNLIMLDLEDELGHIYVTRNTYDQAILIADRFNHSIEAVVNKLGSDLNQEDAVSYMMAVLPRPINILAPFYHLIGEEVDVDVDNLKQTVGILSYMSMSLDFNSMLKVPFEVRANLVFTKSIMMDYANHFDDFVFKINSTERHIVPVGGTTSINRKDREEFVLEEKVVDELIDVDEFFADCGWNDIEIPKLNTNPKEEVKEVKEETKEEASKGNPYEDIIKRFSAVEVG